MNEPKSRNPSRENACRAPTWRHPRKLRRTPLYFAVMFLLDLAACGSDDSPAPASLGGAGGGAQMRNDPAPAQADEIVGVLRRAHSLPPPDSNIPDVSAVCPPVGDPYTVAVINSDKQRVCQNYHCDAAASPEEFSIFEEKNDALFPGSPIQGKGLLAGELDPVPLARAGATLTLTKVYKGSLPGQQHIFVPQLSLSTAIEAVNQLANQLTAISQPTITVHDAYSEDQLAVTLNTNVTGKSFSASAKISFDHSYTGARLLVHIYQPYFSVAMDPPAGPGAFFAPSVTADQLARYVQADNPVQYISTVTYGRVMLLLYETNHRRDQLKAAAGLKVDNAALNVDLEAGVSADDVLDDTQIRIFMLGGGGDQSMYGALVQALKSDKKAVYDLAQKFMESGAEFGPGVVAAPVMYSTKNLADDVHSTVSVSTDYTAASCSDQPIAVKEQTVIHRENNGYTGISKRLMFGGACDEGYRRFKCRTELDASKGGGNCWTVDAHDQATSTNAWVNPGDDSRHDCKCWVHFGGDGNLGSSNFTQCRIIVTELQEPSISNSEP